MNKTRGILTLLLILTILSSLVLAQTNTPNPTNSNPLETKKITDIGDSLTEKEILVNENIAIIVRALLGINGPVTLSFVIMIILIWLMMLILLRNILVLTPFFKGFFSWIGAIIANLLIAFSGGLKLLTKIFLEGGSIFKFLESWTTGALIFSIILTIIIFTVLIKALSFIKRKEEKMEAENEGRIIGMQIGFISSMKKWFGFSKKLGGG